MALEKNQNKLYLEALKAGNTDKTLAILKTFSNECSWVVDVTYKSLEKTLKK